MNRRELGDWQTPPELARQLVRDLEPPRSVLEPTCGRGAFLSAAAERFPNAALHGYDLSAAHLKHVPVRAALRRANFFEVDWEAELDKLPEPILVLGNPPWVMT